MSIEKELYERARGVEFLFRLGVSLVLPSSALFTAATWFHRFFMRFALEDYHRQDVAAACIFLATKTEECGRKLKDVAKVCLAKIHNIPHMEEIPSDSPQVEECQTAILQAEEALLEALCFDFVVESPHAHLLELFENTPASDDLTETYAWSIACDSYRTPLCILYTPKVIAAACYVLAQRVREGPHSPSLDARIALSAPGASLPTPPTHKPASPDASRYAVDQLQLSEQEVTGVSDSLSILLEFYNAQDLQDKAQHLSSIASIPPPSVARSLERGCLYPPISHIALKSTASTVQHNSEQLHNLTPNSANGSITPHRILEAEPQAPASARSPRQ
ncbi:cyclin-like protein [Punctularia strigosozonata HHB-11173 SS5]|uniref:cyclin-like protein n=1 Tax=Punctularia strigosozonata (strain HHB-11173) TaxID=741275 RepID=UPI00044181B0|nr:cyclin-like protein [Punctularia strigosozonata HHB-11173 SS5]EIN07413.1 cyclin-like protein [Punctularia strigosozonata HHB-11173 SS5]